MRKVLLYWRRPVYYFRLSEDSDSEAQVRRGIDFSCGREEGQSQVMMFLLSRVTMTGGCTPQDFQVWVYILSNAFGIRKGKKVHFSHIYGERAPLKCEKNGNLGFSWFGSWMFEKIRIFKSNIYPWFQGPGNGNREIRVVIWHSERCMGRDSGGRLNKVIRRAIASRTRPGRAHVRAVMSQAHHGGHQWPREIKTKMIRDSDLRLSRVVTTRLTSACCSIMSPLEREPGPVPVPRAPGDGYLGARRDLVSV